MRGEEWNFRPRTGSTPPGNVSEPRFFVLAEAPDSREGPAFPMAPSQSHWPPHL